VPKAQASGGRRAMLSLKSPFLGFKVILKNVADFKKNDGNGMDPHLTV